MTPPPNWQTHHNLRLVEKLKKTRTECCGLEERRQFGQLPKRLCCSLTAVCSKQGAPLKWLVAVDVPSVAARTAAPNSGTAFQPAAPDRPPADWSRETWRLIGGQPLKEPQWSEEELQTESLWTPCRKCERRASGLTLNVWQRLPMVQMYRMVGGEVSDRKNVTAVPPPLVSTPCYRHRRCNPPAAVCRPA